ncbi:hypothetical protein TNCV_2653311 [Trichonephila clavipes]|nr:hypothetical protein TNCV_2653311 [Trichonephila clavipes]
MAMLARILGWNISGLNFRHIVKPGNIFFTGAPTHNQILPVLFQVNIKRNAEFLRQPIESIFTLPSINQRAASKLSGKPKKNFENFPQKRHRSRDSRIPSIPSTNQSPSCPTKKKKKKIPSKTCPDMGLRRVFTVQMPKK